MTRRGVLGSGILLLLAGVAGCAKSVQEAEAPEVLSRTLSLGLWAGAPGAEFGAPVDVVHGSRRIRGPLAWTHPITGEQLQVYERVNQEPGGIKRQLFTLREDGSALARVYDSRPGQSDRIFVGDAFFPMGQWTREERRSYPVVVYQDGQARENIATIRIRELSYDYEDTPGSLKYDWILTDPAGRKIFDERFIYSPRIGLAKYSNRMD